MTGLSNPARGAWRLATPPGVVTSLTLVLAAYYSLVVLGNITDYGTNEEFVRHVLAMDTTFKDPDLAWRAIRNPGLQTAAYLLIIAWEAVTALVLVYALVRWVRALRTGGGYERARRLTTLGALLGMLLFGGGFIVIGGEWFAMWQSSQWNGLGAAFQNFVIAALVVLLAVMPSQAWDQSSASLGASEVESPDRPAT
jgi:predicted small integral membrane protein